jgi:hypothetical protein
LRGELKVDEPFAGGRLWSGDRARDAERSFVGIECVDVEVAVVFYEREDFTDGTFVAGGREVDLPV